MLIVNWVISSLVIGSFDYCQLVTANCKLVH